MPEEIGVMGKERVGRINLTGGPVRFVYIIYVRFWAAPPWPKRKGNLASDKNHKIHEMKPESCGPGRHRPPCYRNRGRAAADFLKETCSQPLVDCVVDSDFPGCRVVVFMSQLLLLCSNTSESCSTKAEDLLFKDDLYDYQTLLHRYYVYQLS